MTNKPKAQSSTEWYRINYPGWRYYAGYAVYWIPAMMALKGIPGGNLACNVARPLFQALRKYQ